MPHISASFSWDNSFFCRRRRTRSPTNALMSCISSIVRVRFAGSLLAIDRLAIASNMDGIALYVVYRSLSQSSCLMAWRMPKWHKNHFGTKVQNLDDMDVPFTVARLGSRSVLQLRRCHRVAQVGANSMTVVLACRGCAKVTRWHA